MTEIDPFQRITAIQLSTKWTVALKAEQDDPGIRWFIQSSPCQLSTTPFLVTGAWGSVTLQGPAPAAYTTAAGLADVLLATYTGDQTGTVHAGPVRTPFVQCTQTFPGVAIFRYADACNLAPPYCDHVAQAGYTNAADVNTLTIYYQSPAAWSIGDGWQLGEAVTAVFP